MDEVSGQKSASLQTEASKADNPQQEKPTFRKYAVIGIAVFTGITLGSLIFVTKNLNQTMPKEQIVAAPNNEAFLTLTSPTQAAVALNDEILVSGKTLPDTTIAVYSDIDETIVDSDSEGNFESTVLIDQSTGLIRVTAFFANGEELSQTTALTKNDAVLGDSDEKKEENSGKSETKDQSSENEQEKEQENKQENKHEKEDRETPQPKTEREHRKNSEPRPTGEKEKEDQINDFLSEKDTHKKTEKLGGMKIKELLSEGTESASLTHDKPLKIQKLAATTASNGAQLKRHAVSGIITAISDTSITLAHQIRGERMYTVYYNAQTIIKSKTQPSDEEASGSAEVALSSPLAVGMRITAVGVLVDEELLAKRIHVIPGKAKGVFNRQQTATPTVSPTDLPVSATPTEIITPTP